MPSTVTQSKAQPETHLQRTLTSVLNELPVDSALAAIFHQEHGPLVGHVARGFTARDVHAILRTLSAPAVTDRASAHDQDGSRTMRVRMVTPGAKSLLSTPLKYRNRTYGFLVIGRKEGAAFAKKEKGLMDQASDDITKALDREGLFNINFVLSRALVSNEPSAPAQSVADMFVAPVSQVTPELQEKIQSVLNDANHTVPFDRAWVCHYDPIAGNVEVLGLAGDVRGDQKDGKKDLKPGHRLTLDSSAAGWAIRHRKPRVDHDLASTQGRFLDHKQLFKDRFQSSLVLPFFVRGQVGGTLSLASREAGRYQPTDARTLEPGILKLAELLQAPASQPSQAKSDPGAPDTEGVPASQDAVPLEPVIRKQERQAAIGEFSAFLATEIREPLGSIRAQLEEVTLADPLTGLFNRRFLEQRLEEELNRCGRQQQHVTILLVDLDNFKVYNELCGHAAGDVVLKKTARLLKSSARQMDILTRFGGERFCIILPGTSKKESFCVAERFRREVERAGFTHEENLPQGRLTVSIGIATAPANGNDVHSLLGSADVALHRAKLSGRNRVVHFDSPASANPAASAPVFRPLGEPKARA